MSSKFLAFLTMCSRRFSKNELKGWHPAIVVFSLEEMVRVQAVHTPQMTRDVELWIETESNKIAWPETQTKNEKQENFLYFQEFFKNIEPAEIATVSSTTISERSQTK